MTRRERVLRSIGHREPDRVPVDLGSTPSSGISAIAYSNLLKHLGMGGGKTRVYDVCQQVAQPEDAILDRFQVDVIDIGRSFNSDDHDWHSIVLPNGTCVEYPIWFAPVRQPDGGFVAYSDDGQVLARMPEGATFFDQSVFPYLSGYPKSFDSLSSEMEHISWQAFAHSPWDHAREPDFWGELRENAIRLRRTTDFALMVVAGCNLFEWGTFFRRIDNFLMDLAGELRVVERFLDSLMEVHLRSLEKVCTAVGDVVDIIRFGDDLGTDSGMFMRLDTYRKLFKPRQTILCDYVKKHSSMHTFLHSCGGIAELIPDFVEAGFEIINPVQTNARGMAPERLKREFGEDITFWGGGVDTRTILNGGTPQQVKDQVKQRLETFLPGGGYVFSAVHNILPDVPPENVAAMFEAVAEFNR